MPKRNPVCVRLEQRSVCERCAIGREERGFLGTKNASRVGNGSMGKAAFSYFYCVGGDSA